MVIFSGGQTGVDRAALDIALEAGVACGGFCPKGRRSEDGTIPSRYPLTETPTDNYSERTELNVKAGDGTLVFISGSADKGTTITLTLCKVYNKPTLVIDLSIQNQPEKIMEWIKENHIATLNIAGCRESFSPGIYQQARLFLRQALINKI